MADESLLQGKKILIADDEPDVLDTLEDLLDMCKIIKASSYKDAQNLLESHEFDMAIFDKR
jgi:DNA-binding NtrC family response regulator